jgi:hypothetical protein
VLIAVNTDSHSMGELQLVRGGLDQARRAVWKNLPFSTARLGKSFTAYSKGNDRRVATPSR